MSRCDKRSCSRAACVGDTATWEDEEDEEGEGDCSDAMNCDGAESKDESAFICGSLSWLMAILSWMWSLAQMRLLVECPIPWKAVRAI